MRASRPGFTFHIGVISYVICLTMFTPVVLILVMVHVSVQYVEIYALVH